MPGLTRGQILALIPHQGAMCLLDSVVEWDRAHIHCRSETHHIERPHPLRRHDGIAAVHLIEYAAQAVAVHGGLLAGLSGERRRSAGVLAGLRDVVWVGDRVDAITAPLHIHVYRELGSPQGMIYRFAVKSAGLARACGWLTIMRNANGA